MPQIESQSGFEEFMDLQMKFVDIVAPDEAAKIQWAEKHGKNFRTFCDNAEPELKARLIQAVEDNDAHTCLTLVEEFARYESEEEKGKAALH